MSKYKYIPSPETGCLSERDSKKYFSTVGLAVAAMMVAIYAAIIPLNLLLVRFLPKVAALPWIDSLMSAICIYGIGFPVLLLILRRLPKDKPDSTRLGAVNVLGVIGVAVIFITIGSNVSSVIITLFEQISGRSFSNPVSSSMTATPLWADLLFVVILAPIFEELIFRKVLCDRLLPLGEGYAVVLSSVVFGLIHGNLFQFFYSFLLGMLFAFIYVKTGRLRYSVLLHAGVNLLGGIISPWLNEKLTPILSDPDFMMRIMKAGLQGDLQLFLSEAGEMALPFCLMIVYENLFLFATVFGFIFLFRRRKQITLCEGLLPPDREGRISNVLCNVGVAAAVTIFAGLFIMSLL